MRLRARASVLLSAFLGGWMALVPIGAGVAAGDTAPQDLPFVLRPGDVVANAPLGVVRNRVLELDRTFLSAPVGVRRQEPPPIPLATVLYAAPVGLHRGPYVSGIHPGILDAGVEGQLVTFSGTGLAAASGVAVEPADAIQVTSVVAAAGGESVAVLLDVGEEAEAGLRSIRLTATGGASYPVLTAAARQVMVATPQPVIDSVSPPLVLPGQSVTLTLRGRHLRGLPYQQGTRALDEPVIRLEPADGIQIGTDVQSNEAGTLVTASVQVLADAQAGARVVLLRTASGESTADPLPGNTLSVVHGDLVERTPVLSPLLGITRQAQSSRDVPAFGSAVGVVRGAAVTGMVPGEVQVGSTVTLELQGQGLAGASAVSVSPGDGISVEADTMLASDTQVLVDITVAGDAPLFPRQVSLQLEHSVLTAPGLLEVRSPEPVVAALAPTYLLRTGANQTLDIQGLHLTQTTAARVLPDDGIIVDEYTVIDVGRARVVLRAAEQSTTGPRVLQVLGPAGASSTLPAPGNTFYITDRSHVLTPLVAPALGVRRQPAAGATELATFSSPLGVVRGAYASAMTPSLLRRGRTTRVRVEGRGLGQITTLDVHEPDGIVVEGLVIDQDGSAVEADLVVAADADPGVRRVELKADEATIAFAPAEAALLAIDDNDAEGPEGAPDSYAAVANGILDVPAEQGVLANDHEPGGATLFAILRSLPASGTLNLRADGSFVYTPDPDYVGIDAFQYSPGSVTAIGQVVTVTLAIAELDDAVDDQYSTMDNATLEVDAGNGLLANDVLDDGLPTIELLNQPALGELQLAADGGFAYAPHGSSGVEVIGYRLARSGIRSLPATLTINILDVNEPPTAADDSYVVDRGVRLDVPAAAGVLANDSDPDGDPLTARVTASPVVGALSMGPNGSFSYTPPADFVGEVAFAYESVDPHGLAAAASVLLYVNEGLAAQPDAYALDEGSILFVGAANGLLANDSIFAQGALQVLLDRAPEHGTVQLGSDGSFVYSPDGADVHGDDSFAYRLQDDVATSNAANVAIDVRPTNDAPVPLGDEYLTDENADLLVPAPGLLANDSDVDGDALSVELVSPPNNGTALLQADGGFSYVPQVNFRGVDSFEYAAVDAQGAATSAEVRILVTQPPTATNDVYLVDVGVPLEIVDPEQGLLANDHDAPEHDPLSALLDEPPAHGVLELAADGTFFYVPDPAYSGLDVFTYQVTDGRSQSNIGSVTLAVGITSLPRAVPDAYTLEEDAEFLVSASEGVLVNDLDADTPPAGLQAFLVGRGYHRGQPLDVDLDLDGSFRVRPWGDFYGETFFVYQVYDGTDISNAAIVTLTVLPRNDGVTANDDAFGVLRNTVFQSSVAGRRSIRFNDSYDPDHPLGFEVEVPPASGSVQMDITSGQFSYTPPQDFSGLETFTYRVWQLDTGIADTALVTLRTNGPPVAGPDYYLAQEDMAETPVLPGLLDNDADPDGDPLELTQTSYAYHYQGWAIVSVDDRFSPAETRVRTNRHFYGTAEFQYWISDGAAESRGTITVEVLPTPDDPVAAGDSYLTHRNTPLSVSSPSNGVLRNDFDPDTRPWAGAPPWDAADGVDLEPLVAELTEDVQSGTLDLLPGGTFVYVPSVDFSGTDRFRYQVRDGTSRYSEPVEVLIRVNSPAVANDDAYVATEDVILEVDAADGLLVNDTDADDDALTASFSANGCAPCNGSVTVRSSGSFRYTPDPDFHGEDEFFYRVRDGVADSDIGRVAITVLPVNDPPLPDADTYRTREDEVLVAPEPQGTLRNDREVDGDPLVGSELVQAASHGSVQYESDGSFTYTPDVDFSGRDTFRYRVFDITGLFAEEEVEVLVTPVNDAPHAVPDGYETAQDAVLQVPVANGVLANDHDVDGPTLSVSLIGPPDHGQVQLAADGSFTYLPDGHHAGLDRFVYQLDDGLGELAVAEVTIQVHPVEPEVAVVAGTDFYRFTGPQLVVLPPGVLGNDTVTGSEVLEAEQVTAPAIGTLVLHRDGSFEYSAPDGFEGVAGFAYAAVSEGVTSIAYVTLDVRYGGNAPPHAQGEQYLTLEDTVLDSRHFGSLLLNDSDHEGAPLTVILQAQPAHGTLQELGDGHFVFSPHADFHGKDGFDYAVSDGAELSQTVRAEILVHPQNDPPVAADDTWHTRPGTPLLVATSKGVLANDTDVDGDPLLVELVDAPQGGQLSMDPAGGFEYTPLPGFSGADQFRYAASDLLDMSVATVRLTIAATNHPPVAQGEAFVIDEDTWLRSEDVGRLTDNDSDPDGDVLTVLLAEAPAHGALQLDDGGFKYLPQANWSGADAFSYTVSDGEFTAGPVEAQVTVTPVNDPPMAVSDAYSVLHGALLHVVAAQGVLSNDTDAEGDSLTARLVSLPSHGQLELHPDGSFAYQPIIGFTGREEFSYASSDGVAEAVGRVVIDVTSGPNARPVATGERYSIAEDTEFDSRNFSHPLANDHDPDGDPLLLMPLDPPIVGTVEWLEDGHLRFVPPRDYSGNVAIGYQVSDGELESTPVQLVLDLLPQNDPPQAEADVYYLPPAQAELEVPAAGGLLRNDRDPDGDVLASQVQQLPASGQVRIGLDGSFRYTPQSPRASMDTFRYRVSDAHGTHSDADVLLLMDPALAPAAIFSSGFEQDSP